ncbi:MAG: hypothetical protein FWH35_06995 [Treponema sp.]|nr:hypothetical protein [Treponema sp.]
MKSFFIRFINMIFGLFLYALGIVVTVKANIGYAPWDVFHYGLSNTFNISFGSCSIIVGTIIMAVLLLLKEKIGLGTIFNIILIGLFLDIILFIDLIPIPLNFALGIIMLLAGLFIIALGSYFYIKTAFGTGPRDSLMVVLARRTKIPIGICRSAVELAATLAGWFLGGLVGVGTVISVIGIGFCIQIVFRIFNFDATIIKHESLYDTFKFFKKMKAA